MNNLNRLTLNPRAFTLKKWMFEVLKSTAMQHEAILERIASSLITDRDMDDFGKLISAVYESAYFKAVNDYKQEFEKYGVTINVIPGTQSEKSGFKSDDTQS